MCILQKKIHKKYKIRVLQNKEHMITSYQLKKMKEKQGRLKIRPKLGRNLSKLVKNWYYVHLETKKYIKNIKLGYSRIIGPISAEFWDVSAFVPTFFN